MLEFFLALFTNLYLFYLKIVNLAQTAREQSCDY